MSSDQSQVSRTEVGEGLVNVAAGESEQNVKQHYGIVAEIDKPLSEPVRLLSEPEVVIEVMQSSREILARWDGLEGADHYRYELARDESFNDIVVEDSTTETSLKFASIETGAYYFRVRGVLKNQLQGLNGVSIFDMPNYEDSTWKVVMTIGIILLIL